MNQLVLLHPERWPVLLAPLLIALLAYSLGGRRRRALGRFGEVGAHPLLLADAGPRGRGLRRILELLGLLLLSLSALEPAYGHTMVEVERRGVDLVLCLDLSRSMNARDLAPSRGERARQDILDLLPVLKGDRLALVGFAGDARIVCPLTHDLRAFEGLLQRTHDEYTRRGGTHLGAALKTALALLPGDQVRSQAILLLTDGEDLAGKGRTEAASARSRGIRIHAVGYGSALGARVPGKEPGTFLKDEEGREITSKMDAQGLRELAEGAGGEFLPAEASALPLVQIYEKRILPMEQRRYEKQKRRRHRSRYQWLLLPGFLCLFLAFLARGRGARREGSAC